MAKKNKVLRVGFIGAGDIADLQLKCLARRKDVVVQAIADISERTLERRRSELPDAHLYTDYQKMLKEERLDAVSVCTPNIHHMQPTIDALKSKNHVLCEKPLTVNPEECQQLLAEATSMDAYLMEGMWTYFLPAIQKAISWVDEGGGIESDCIK